MDHPSRRGFLGSAAGLEITMSLTQTSAAQNSQAEIGKFDLSAATQRLLSQFGLTYPIFQAPTGSGAGPELAIAVSSAGAMGGMALWPFPPDEASCARRPASPSLSITFWPKSPDRSKPLSMPVRQSCNSLGGCRIERSLPLSAKPARRWVSR